MRIVDQAPDWLAKDGTLALEVGTPDQAANVMAAIGAFPTRGLRHDDNGRPRVVWASR
jgi:methylase of polypeptide subunit release factors